MKLMYPRSEIFFLTESSSLLRSSTDAVISCVLNSLRLFPVLSKKSVNAFWMLSISDLICSCLVAISTASCCFRSNFSLKSEFVRFISAVRSSMVTLSPAISSLMSCNPAAVSALPFFRSSIFSRISLTLLSSACTECDASEKSNSICWRLDLMSFMEFLRDSALALNWTSSISRSRRSDSLRISMLESLSFSAVRSCILVRLLLSS